MLAHRTVVTKGILSPTESFGTITGTETAQQLLSSNVSSAAAAAQSQNGVLFWSWALPLSVLVVHRCLHIVTLLSIIILTEIAGAGALYKPTQNDGRIFWRH